MTRRLSICLSSKDLQAIQKRALAEGLPYQTLISSVLRKPSARPGFSPHPRECALVRG
jgi:predicted DNA binding CopG/RHH family protein